MSGMSLWRRSKPSVSKEEKKGLDGVVLTINEEQRPKSSYRKLQRKTSMSIASMIAEEDANSTMYDVAIAGAGPAGLMLA
jgi:NADPH-dependent 2,4-dienoyl-CoA reductase/sulfur reductase-like enzyme